MECTPWKGFTTINETRKNAGNVAGNVAKRAEIVADPGSFHRSAHVKTPHFATLYTFVNRMSTVLLWLCDALKRSNQRQAVLMI